MANSNGWGDGAANNSIGWGQGANNAIAWGDSHAKSWAGATDIVGITTDPDAQAFITAAAITDPTQQTAIDTLVKGMKADGLWTKMKAVYPFVGGTASAHKWNLKDPRDLDAAFRLVFNGGWTHSANGATPNGTNGYADTKLNQSSNLTINSAHLSFYSRTNSSLEGFDIGGYDSTFGALLASYYTGIGSLSHMYNYPTDSVASLANSDSRGFYIANRSSQTSNKIHRNSTILAQSTVSRSSLLPSFNVLLSSSTGSTQFSNRQTAFASIGNGLTDTEAANLYTRVQAFQTALSRQV